MTQTNNPNEPTPTSPRNLLNTKVDLWLFVLMLALALIGVGVTQTEHGGGRHYWLFLVLVYAGISVVRTWQRHKGEGRGLWSTIRTQVLHWIGTLAAIFIVFVFEAADITSRAEAADFSLLILALSCYLAGVHFHWLYLLLGTILAVMALGLGYLDQYSLYALLVPLAILGVWIFAKRGVGRAHDA